MMSRDQLEFAISQFLDGSLPPLEQAALEERLATDAEARALLEEYRQLDATLKASCLAPNVAWDRLASHLSEVISREEAPVTTYSLVAWRRAASVALAASLALIIGLAFLAYRSGSAGSDRIAGVSQPIAIVVGPQAEQPAEVAPVVQVAVGPAPSFSDSWRYAESVISRPVIVMIDRAPRSGQDTDSFWY